MRVTKGLREGRARYQPEVFADFVSPELSAAFFFRALRLLVAVSSDLSCHSCVLKVFFSALSRLPRSLILSLYFMALIPIRCATLFVNHPCTTHTDWRIDAQAIRRRCFSKLASKSNMQRKVRCTICDSVIVRSSRRRCFASSGQELASLLWSHCQSECTINAKNKNLLRNQIIGL